MFDLFLDLVGPLAQGMEEGFRTIPKVSGLCRDYSNFLKIGDFQFGLHALIWAMEPLSRELNSALESLLCMASSSTMLEQINPEISFLKFYMHLWLFAIN